VPLVFGHCAMLYASTMLLMSTSASNTKAIPKVQNISKIIASLKPFLMFSATTATGRKKNLFVLLSI